MGDLKNAKKGSLYPRILEANEGFGRPLSSFCKPGSGPLPCLLERGYHLQKGRPMLTNQVELNVPPLGKVPVNTRKTHPGSKESTTQTGSPQKQGGIHRGLWVCVKKWSAPTHACCLFGLPCKPRRNDTPHTHTHTPLFFGCFSNGNQTGNPPEGPSLRIETYPMNFDLIGPGVQLLRLLQYSTRLSRELAQKLSALSAPRFVSGVFNAKNKMQGVSDRV